MIPCDNYANYYVMHSGRLLQFLTAAMTINNSSRRFQWQQDTTVRASVKDDFDGDPRDKEYKRQYGDETKPKTNLFE